MSFSYYDPLLDKKRFKRRYVWALWAYLTGFTSAVIILALVQH